MSESTVRITTSAPLGDVKAYTEELRKAAAAAQDIGGGGGADATESWRLTGGGGGPDGHRNAARAAEADARAGAGGTGGGSGRGGGGGKGPDEHRKAAREAEAAARAQRAEAREGRAAEKHEAWQTGRESREAARSAEAAARADSARAAHIGHFLASGLSGVGGFAGGYLGGVVGSHWDSPKTGQMIGGYLGKQAQAAAGWAWDHTPSTIGVARREIGEFTGLIGSGAAWAGRGAMDVGRMGSNYARDAGNRVTQMGLGDSLSGFLMGSGQTFMELNTIVGHLDQKFRNAAGGVASFGNALGWTRAQTAGIAESLGDKTDSFSKVEFQRYGGFARVMGIDPSMAMSHLGSISQMRGGPLSDYHLAMMQGQATQQGMGMGRFGEYLGAFQGMAASAFEQTGEAGIGGTMTNMGLGAQVFGAGDARGQGQMGQSLVSGLNSTLTNKSAMQAYLMRSMGYGMPGSNMSYMDMKMRYSLSRSFSDIDTDIITIWLVLTKIFSQIGNNFFQKIKKIQLFIGSKFAWRKNMTPWNELDMTNIHRKWIP